MPLSQMEGVQQQSAQLLTMMPATSPADYENIVARIAGVPTLVDQTIALMREGLAAGLTPPRITLRDVPQQVRNQIVDDPLASPMLAAVQALPGDGRRRPSASGCARRRSAAYRGRRRARVPPAARVPGDRVHPAHARDDRGLRDLPDGEAWYAYKVRQSTTTDLDAAARSTTSASPR